MFFFYELAPEEETVYKICRQALLELHSGHKRSYRYHIEKVKHWQWTTLTWWVHNLQWTVTNDGIWKKEKKAHGKAIFFPFFCQQRIGYTTVYRGHAAQKIKHAKTYLSVWL